jgi:hypothetical protein
MRSLRVSSRFGIGLVAAFGFCAALAQSASRLPMPPPELGARSSWKLVSQGAFYEVQTSRAEQAAEWLGSSDFLLLKKERTDDIYFAQVDKNCRSPQQLVLIRANYINGATGVFRLYWAGGSLIVAHEFLGPQKEVHQTALVACLPHVPDMVYAIMPGAL